ncbi:MAG: precorrin-8X methylmutase [Desulfotignum balticum]|jgi:precorrin-8X/cobalt-precorrin-8 methylmutase|uniref:Precorrin-8X methylmutase n=1 Tax=Desulfotignum balticum TaxID=115781 RepID=A0A931GDY9_9BACT|nr:precorrin-8X methylmutase [Desulfotignum balticum]
MKPQEIETLSFKIIDNEAQGHGFGPAEWPVVRRLIHTSADFDYLNTIRFHKDAIAAGITAIRSGKPIITDTEMARSGIRKTALVPFGNRVICRISDSDVADAARKNGTTRALEAVNRSVPEMEGGIYVVGNAPTALLRLIELIQAQKAFPALILGFPVGFVNAAESKALLLEHDIPYITNTGRKGGSNIAAAALNALIILSMDKQL